MIGSLLFFALMIGLAIAGRLPWVVPLVYLIMSAITILAYAFDKSAAMNRRWRTKEDTLHLFSLLCGWPGAWIAITCKRVARTAKKNPRECMYTCLSTSSQPR